MTAAVQTPELTPATAADSRAVGRVVELASGLLMLLDEHGITGRLPLDARAGEPSPPRGQARHSSHQRHQRHQPAGAGRADGPRSCRRAARVDRRPAVGAARPGGLGVPAVLPRPGHRRALRRISREHRNPHWSGPGRLVQVALAAGLTFELAWLEYPATLGRERRLRLLGAHLGRVAARGARLGADDRRRPVADPRRPRGGPLGAAPGDLVFYAYHLGDWRSIHHVGLYVGRGLMAEAPYSGARVRLASINRAGWFGAARPGGAR